MIVAVFGTTISPYLLFWQASQEAEDIRAVPEREILKRAPEQGPDAIKRIELDTLIGMGFSNFIALAIILTAAATLNVSGVTDIETSAQAAEALRPIADNYAATIFAFSARDFWPFRSLPAPQRTPFAKPVSGRLALPDSPRKRKRSMRPL